MLVVSQAPLLASRDPHNSSPYGLLTDPLETWQLLLQSQEAHLFGFWSFLKSLADKVSPPKIASLWVNLNSVDLQVQISHLCHTMWYNHGNTIQSLLPYSMNRGKSQVLPSLEGGALHTAMIHWGSSWSYAYHSSFNITSFRSSLLFSATELLSNSHGPSGTFLS